MAVTRAQKAVQLTELQDKLSKSVSVMFAHYIGLKVSDVSDFRRKLKGAKAEMKVAKKTLIKIASKNVGLPEVQDEAMNGPVACIFSFDDPVVGAQIAFAYGKDHPQVKLIGGIFDGKALSTEEALSFAKLPNRLTLLSTVVGLMRAPLSSFAGLSGTPMRSFAMALNELAKKKEATPS